MKNPQKVLQERIIELAELYEIPALLKVVVSPSKEDLNDLFGVVNYGLITVFSALEISKMKVPSELDDVILDNFIESMSGLVNQANSVVTKLKDIREKQPKK